MSDYHHHLNRSNMLSVIYWQKYFEMIVDVQGDIVECGVGRGRSLSIILTMLLMSRLLGDSAYADRKVFALDSFEGFPEPRGEDVSFRKPQKGEWARSPNNSFEYSEENLLKILTLAGLLSHPPSEESASLRDILFDSSRLAIVRGYFETTTLNLATDSIALLHLDGDLYSSVKAPLNNLWQKIQVGGIVVIDDYYLNLDEYPERQEPFPGARLAVEEFMSEKKNFILKESIRGTPYLVKISR